MYLRLSIKSIVVRVFPQSCTTRRSGRQKYGTPRGTTNSQPTHTAAAPSRHVQTGVSYISCMKAYKARKYARSSIIDSLPVWVRGHPRYYSCCCCYCLKNNYKHMYVYIIPRCTPCGSRTEHIRACRCERRTLFSASRGGPEDKGSSKKTNKQAKTSPQRGADTYYHWAART